MVLLAERTKNQKLIDQLDQIPLGRMYQASFKAVVRLHLYFTGRTHEMMLEFTEKAEAVILKKSGKEQVLDGTSGYIVQTELLKLWGDTFKEWSEEFEKIRNEAAAIPFGVLAVTHERLVMPLTTKVEESVQDGVFGPHLHILLNAASEHLYGDSLDLSQRIWRMDRETRDGINTVLMNGISNGSSAWDIAQQLEQYMGAGKDCPRWTSTRLYGRTKGEIASGDTTGLLSGNACDGRGVSYNALRLARTEIQKVHALATDRIMAQQPWVEKEQVHLSAAHPETDICDDTVSGGEGGKGIYAVGEIELPLHPNCLCYKTAVLMDEKDFTAQLRGWMTGDRDWREMDDYQDLIGGDVNQSILPNAINLAVWLFGDNLEKWLK
ncbi:MAG: hypothetical protein EHM40_11585 [Chloroflexi bacterium]|nr:MAG: hypothetical protein EHM40_11585 [Chloroflexota bacterium]